MFMGPYRNCYEQVYVFSPLRALGVGRAWDAWCQRAKTHVDAPDDQQTMWGTWEPKKLEELCVRHKNVNAYLKAKKQKKRFCILVLVDDFADAGDKVMHNSTNVLTSLFVCGRHTGCACWLLSQTIRVISLSCRTNFCWMLR